MTKVKMYSNQEAIGIAGSAQTAIGTSLNVDQWSKFVDANVDEAFIERACALFEQVTPDLDGLEALCGFIASGVQPNRLIAIESNPVISCRVAPGVFNGLVNEKGRMSLGVCWANGWKLILNPQASDLTLTFGVRDNHQLELSKAQFDKAAGIIKQWGNVIAGKRVVSAW